MPQDVKNRRVFEMAKLYRAGAEELNAACVGTKQLILIEGVSMPIGYCAKFHNSLTVDFHFYPYRFRRANVRQRHFSVEMKPTQR